MNVNEVKVRCHALKKVMTFERGAVITPNQLLRIDELIVKRQSGKPLTANQAEELDGLITKRDTPPPLSATTIEYLTELYLWYRYGRRKIHTNKYVEKGLKVEEDSATIYSLVKSRPFFKNQETFTHDPDFIGTPDENTPDSQDVKDFKSSWDLLTFTAAAAAPINPVYDWQLQGYCELTKKKTGRLIYVLCNTPPELLNDEKRRLAWRMGVQDPDGPDNELYREAAELIDFNGLFDDIPLIERVHEKTITHDPAKIRDARAQVQRCRSWMAATWPDFFDVSKDNCHPNARTK
jgi:hypothetical protein